MLLECVKQFGYDPKCNSSVGLLEREAVIEQLRDVCRELGDNDWEESMHLADILDKHFGMHLYANAAT